MSIKSLNRLIAQVFQKTTLQTVLMAVFGLQILTTGGVIGYLSFRNGQQGIDNLVQRLQKEASEQVEQHLATYLAIPPKISYSLFQNNEVHFFLPPASCLKVTISVPH